MPFTRIPGTDKFKSPSGKTFTLQQIKLYYAHGGQFPKKKKKIKIKENKK